jgi:hypothetical protein
LFIPTGFACCCPFYQQIANALWTKRQRCAPEGKAFCCPFCLAKQSLGQKGNAALQQALPVAVRFVCKSLSLFGRKGNAALQKAKPSAVRFISKSLMLFG